MHSDRCRRTFRLGVWLLALVSSLTSFNALACAQEARMKFVLAGDSTVTDDAGWGLGFAHALNDQALCINLSAGGRSSKSFLDEGLWKKVLDQKPNYVLIQFGHNDQPGKGPERETTPSTTYSENLSRYIDEARQAGAKPILLTSLVRRLFDESGTKESSTKIRSNLIEYVEAARNVAAKKQVPLIELHDNSMVICNALGPELCKKISPPGTNGEDRTHLNAIGSELIGSWVAREVAIQLPETARLINQSFVVPTTAEGWRQRFEEISAKQPQTPSQRIRVVLVGDSTVKNGQGKGDDGLWGWGQVLAEHFDASRVEIENRALGGRSSRTYITEGLWAKSLERLRPGDYVLIQFGHNDGGEMFEGNRPRASIKGNGDETQEGVVVATGRKEIVHSYGWYIRKYVADAKAKGAIPIVLSLVPRNRWEGDRVIRSNNDYARWAKEAAAANDAYFVDLNEIVALRYESLGKEQVARELFTEKDWTHTTQAGAKLNAACVVDGLKKLEACSLKDYLRLK